MDIVDKRKQILWADIVRVTEETITAIRLILTPLQCSEYY